MLRGFTSRRKYPTAHRLGGSPEPYGILPASFDFPNCPLYKYDVAEYWVDHRGNHHWQEKAAGMTEISHGRKISWRLSFDFPFLFPVVLVALVLRLVVMAFLYTEQLDPARDHWKFAYETGRIARSLATGRGFSSPLFADTGPTAFLTPVYPAIIAVIFKLFGVYSKASAFVI